MKMRTRNGMLSLVLALSMATPMAAQSQQVEEAPTALAMVGDLVVARPIGLVMTLVGSLVYVVSLPFTLAGGNAGAAAETLVIGPAQTTFVRCLGCTRLGYRDKIYAIEDEN